MGSGRIAVRPVVVTASPQTFEESESAGLPARRLAADLVEGVVFRKQSFELMQQALDQAELSREDRGFTMMLTLTTLRHYGGLIALVDSRLSKPLPQRARRIETILALGLAQLIILKTPPHAAVTTSVELAKEDMATQALAPLVNAVLRRLSEQDDLTIDVEKVLPVWLFERWQKNYGRSVALSMVRAQLGEPPLDLTVKDDPQIWAKKLSAEILSTGTLRVARHKGGIASLPGYDEGAWWVQDAGALLPVLALGDVQGKNVLDLCAAPGGKTAALRARGAQVTALDRSQTRLDMLRQNLQRLDLEARIVCADATKWQPDQEYDAILLDAPCSSTGTLRRHPDVAFTKSERDIARLAHLQGLLLKRAAGWLKPGGVLVYATCSLEPEEGECQIEALLAENSEMRLSPLQPSAFGDLSEVLTAKGTVRARPDLLDDKGGIDGFYCARLLKQIR